MDRLEPIPSKDQKPVTVESLVYDEEVLTSLKIKMSSEDSFVVSDLNDNELGVGSLYKPFEVDNYSFTLGKNLSDSIANQEFLLNLMPLSYQAKQLAKQLTVEEDSTDESLVLLTFKHYDREEAIAFLNDLMEAYQSYQREEQQRIADEQLSYLNSRQERIEDELRIMMEKHAQTLSSNMSNMDLLIQNQENYAQKLLNINLELSRLTNVKNQGTAYYDRSGAETGDNVVINAILNEIRNLEHQREALKESSKSGKPVDTIVAAEFVNLDLPTATHLYSEQCKGLNHLEGECRQQQFVMEQLDQPQFEITSLSTVNEDKVSNDIIARAIQIELMLKDQNNRTTRELERLREELEQQKKFLSNHVQESHRILQEKKKYTANKIAALQSLSGDLIDKKINLLNKQLAHYVEDRIKTLSQEKNTLKTQQLILQREMQKLPSKWAAQKMVEQQLLTNQNLSQELTSMVESKLIAAQMDLSQSGPLDVAYSPIIQKRPHLLLYTFLGGILTFFLALTWNLLKMQKKNGVAT